MRTMLISLILIYSLAQFAIADAPKEVDSGGCGTVYTCFVPEKCKKPTVTTMADSKVIGINEEAEKMILNDCDAIIRIYRYDEKKTLVSIESFQGSVAKIEFKQYEKDPTKPENANQDELSFFSCEKDASAGKIRGIFYDKLVMEKDISPGKLKCKFEDKRDAPWAQDKRFKKDTDWLTIIAYDDNMSPSSTLPAKIRGDINVRCDPENLDFIKPQDDRTKIYKEVSTKNMPETYECDTRFKMEFKKKGSDSYEVAKSVKCIDDDNKFAVKSTKNDETTEFEDSFEIRCVAETKFFCNYSPKLKDREQFPQLSENADGSQLKCQPEKPYLVIVGEVERYITNPEFKCVTLGNTPIWTVKDRNGDREEILAKTGPTVYCTDHKNCTQSISESAVEGGTLGPDFLPKCFDRGTLKTMDNIDVTKTWCDKSVGVFKYTAGGDEKEIKDTKFICEYPPDDDDQVIAKDQEHREKILSGALYAGIGSAIVGIVVIVVVVLLVRRRAKRYKLDYELKQRENQELYYTPKELAAVRQREANENKQIPSQTTEKSKTTEKTEPRVEKKFKEADAVVSNQQKSMAALMPVNGFARVKNSGHNEQHAKLPISVYGFIKDLNKEDEKTSAVIKRCKTLPNIMDLKNTSLAVLIKKRAGGGEMHDE